ncbi:unnamed protein product [Sphenostylis stenocarpa]|uniref:Uncharacterized protein n=1 Tax=Sphenostylis stenocarpa TaxID=92480 RepID=A0AA87B8S0_9FABA|nr:unnamed protein product [Sphenostylis stenocarpa]
MEKIGNWLVGVENYEVVGVVLGKSWACCRFAWYRETKDVVRCWNLVSGNSVMPRNPFCTFTLTEEAFLGSAEYAVVDSIAYATESGSVGSLFLSSAADKENGLDGFYKNVQLITSNDRFEILED